MSHDKATRICIVLPSHWLARSGGAEHQAYALANELGKHDGVEVFYVARNVNGVATPQHYRIQGIGPSRMTKSLGRLADVGRLLAVLSRIKPDVIYQRVGCAYTGVSAYYAKRHNCRMIWHISSDANVRPLRSGMRLMECGPLCYVEKKIVEYGIRNATSIIAQTRRQAALLFRNYGLRATRVIPNFHPVPKLTASKQAPIKIIWVANIKPMKRPDLFLKLADDLCEMRNIRFIMIGRIEGNRRWKNEINEAIRQVRYVEYIGERPHAEVDEILAQGHILVNTSTYEGLPNTFIEAWMREVAVVSIDVDPDGVLEENGIGFCSGSYEKMREQVRMLVFDSDLRDRMGRCARKYASAHYAEANLRTLAREVIGRP